MVWDFVAWGYLAGVALVFLRQLVFSLLEMDSFAWNAIRQTEFFGFLAMTAVFWPLVVIKKPIVLFKPAAMFESELRKANEERYRSQLERLPPYCSARVLMNHIPNTCEGTQPTGFIFDSQDVEAVLRSVGRFGCFEARDEKALLKWVDFAVLCDDTKTEVPAIWQRAFNMVADELIYKGLGECYCLQCERTYPNKLLVPSTGSTGFGWLQNRYSCPEGHLVLSYDFMKVFCGSRH